jgi:hypothetical protein
MNATRWVVFAVLLPATPATAQETAPSPGWSGSLTVYGRLPWSSIEVTAGNPARSTSDSLDFDLQLFGPAVGVRFED